MNQIARDTDGLPPPAYQSARARPAREGTPATRPEPEAGSISTFDADAAETRIRLRSMGGAGVIVLGLTGFAGVLIALYHVCEFIGGRM